MCKIPDVVVDRGLPAPSVGAFTVGPPDYYSRVCKGRGNAGTSVKADYQCAASNESSSDQEDDNHVAKSMRPNPHWSTLSCPWGGVTEKLTACGFEQMLDRVAENKPTVTSNPSATTTPTAIDSPPLTPTAPPRIKYTPTAPVRIKYIHTLPFQDDSEQSQGSKSHPGIVRVSKPQRRQFAAQPSYLPHQDPEGSYDATAGYPQIHPSSLDHCSCTPISPTTYSRTASLPHSLHAHSATKWYDFERLGNVSSSPRHPFSHMRGNAYTAARTSFIAGNPYGPDETREQMALGEQIYALNQAAASSPDSIPSPSLPPPPASSLPFTPPPTSNYHPRTFIPTACGSSGLGQGMRRKEDPTMSQGHSPRDGLVPLSPSPSPVGGLRKRERQVNISAVQERWIDSGGSGRSGSELVLSKADAPEPRDTNPGMTDAGGKEVHPHIQGKASEWLNRESDQLQFLIDLYRECED